MSMQVVISVLLAVSIVLLTLYLILVMRWLIAWIFLPGNQIPGTFVPVTSVSVIVPFRNEQLVIENILFYLAGQNYPSGLLEVIFSDDFSDDDSIRLLEKGIAGYANTDIKFKVVKPDSSAKAGKKAAIERAVSVADGTLILTTDADCTMGKYWVKSFSLIYETYQPEMITGMVRISGAKSLWHHLQKLEFVSMTASGMASVASGKPILCNGANLAFTREIFLKHSKDSYGQLDPSGDDTYLMLKTWRLNNDTVMFNNNPSGLVSTKPVSLGSFISQRIRWASKLKNYREKHIALTGLLIFIVNSLLILLLALGLLHVITWRLVMLFWFSKMAVDFLFLTKACTFVRQPRLLLLFLPVQTVYPLYTIAAACLGVLSGSYEWKGRNFNVREAR